MKRIICFIAMAGLLKLGLAYWGFKQDNAFGNVAGSVFALQGTVQLFEIKF